MPWQFLFLILVAVVLYILADAFFDVSKRISAKFAGLKFLSPLGALGGALATISGKGWVRLAAIPLVIAGVWGIVSYVEGRGADRERLKQARNDLSVAELETKLATQAVELAEQTHKDGDRVRGVVEQADEEIADAVEQADFDALWSAYSDAYGRVWGGPSGEDGADPDPGRPAHLRGSGADRA